MKSILITLLIFCASISFAQQNVTENSNSIENQFDIIYKKSTTYQVYKVIDKNKYQVLKANVLDSLKSYKKIILKKDQLLNIEKDSIKDTQIILSKTQTELDTALKQANSISILGIQLSKITYNTFVWAFIALLILALSYFIFKFLRSNVLTKEAKSNLIEVEQEFELHRKKTIQKEQKLRRQLQDEINKHRNN